MSVDAGILRNSTPQGLGKSLHGRRFGHPARHGKWLTCSTDRPLLLLHFGMTGELVWSGAEPRRHEHDRLFIEFTTESAATATCASSEAYGSPATRGKQMTSSVRSVPDAHEVSKGEFLESLDKKRGSIRRLS